MSKRRIREIIDKADLSDFASTLYDGLIICCVLLGIYPLVVKDVSQWYYFIELFVGVVYLIDFILRILTKSEDKRKEDDWIIVADFLSILSVFFANKILKLTRIVQLFKLARYFNSLIVLVNVII